jgi:hypothetical protein
MTKLLTDFVNTGIKLTKVTREKRGYLVEDTGLFIHNVANSNYKAAPVKNICTIKI